MYEIIFIQGFFYPPGFVWEYIASILVWQTQFIITFLSVM